MHIEVLGPLRVDGDAMVLQRRDQVLLSALAVRAGEAVRADELAGALWGEEPPRSWPKLVQGGVLRLRRAFGASLIETTATGYRLAVPPEELDSEGFEQLIERGRMLAAEGESERAAVAFGRAMELWRGRPFEVLDGWAPGQIEAARLDELRRGAEENLLDARLQAGEHRDVVALAEARVAEEPLREHRWAILATALYRCGRQADALRALKQARHNLVEQLGIEPGTELVALETAILRQDEALVATPTPPAISEHCPYKGLLPYDIDDNETFFGRSNEITACVDRLRTSPLLVVTGPSGCGKSSLVRAGVVPALQSAGHAVVVFMPGSDPEAAITNAVASVEATPVLVVDQFEELFALDDATLARTLCARLAGYATTGAPVVITVRADHVAALAADDEFARLAEHGLHLVKPLAGDALREAIEGPATLAGLRLEHGLVDLLVRDCEGEPGAMPLLSHALAETWQRRDGRVLTVEGYRATGEIRGAVARSADRLYESLPAEQRPKLRSMMLRLVSPSPDGEPVRSRLATRSLGGDADRERMLGLLVRARLVTTEEDSVELAHEALARAWPRLRSWLDEDAAGQRILRHLATAADGWESLGRPTSELYRGSRLEAALEWRAATTPDLTDEENAFLDASILATDTEREQLAERARQQARQNRRLRRALIGVALLLVAALVGGVLAYQQRQDAQAQRETAQAQRAAAERGERQAALMALTSNAAALRTNRRDMAALLAVEAHRLAPSAATESALFGTFTAFPGLQRIAHTDLELVTFNVDAAYVPNTDNVAMTDGHASVVLVDLATGEVERLEGPSDNDGSTSLAVAAGGRYVATNWSPPNFDEGGTNAYSLITVWDLQAGERRFDPVHVPYVVGLPQGLAINADGSLVAASGGELGRTRIYDGATGEFRVELERLAAPENVNDTTRTALVAFRNDGTLVVGSRVGPIRVVDPTDGTQRSRIDAPPNTSDVAMWVTADGQRLVTLGMPTPGEDFVMMAFDLEAGTPLLPEPHRFPSTCKTWNYTARLGTLGAVLCGEFGGPVAAFDVATGSEIRQRYDSQQGDVCGLAVSADGAHLAELSACLGSAATIVEWQLDGGGPVSRHIDDWQRERHLFVQGYGFAGDPTAIVAEFSTETGDPITRAIDSTDGHVIDSFTGVFGLVPTDDPNVVVALYGDDNTLGLYDINRRVQAGPRIDPDFDEVWLTFASGSYAIFTGADEDGAFLMKGYDVESGRLIGPNIDSHEFHIHNVVITPDVLYTKGFTFGVGNEVARRDRVTGEILGDPVAGYSDVAASGGIVVVNTNDGRILELHPQTLQPIGLAFPGTTGPAAIFLDASGQRLMVHAADGTLRLYDVATRTQLGDPIDGVAKDDTGISYLRADGLQAVADTPTGIVIWDLDPDHWIDAACQLAGRNLTHAEWDQYIGELAPYNQTCPAYPSD